MLRISYENCIRNKLWLSLLIMALRFEHLNMPQYWQLRFELRRQVIWNSKQGRRRLTSPLIDKRVPVFQSIVVDIGYILISRAFIIQFYSCFPHWLYSFVETSYIWMLSYFLFNTWLLVEFFNLLYITLCSTISTSNVVIQLSKLQLILYSIKK